MQLYTKNGIPLFVAKSIVYNTKGVVIGKIHVNLLFCQEGKYVGTIVGDRLVYRLNDSEKTGTPFKARNRFSFAKSNSFCSVIMGEEPNIPK